MPRKYHRPPTAKRRKPKKTTIPYEFEGPEEQPAVATEEDGAEDYDASNGASGMTFAAAQEVSPSAATGRAAPERHVKRDYSYVRAEVLRIAAIAGFLVISLLVTAYFRS